MTRATKIKQQKKKKHASAVLSPSLGSSSVNISMPSSITYIFLPLAAVLVIESIIQLLKNCPRGEFETGSDDTSR